MIKRKKVLSIITFMVIIFAIASAGCSDAEKNQSNVTSSALNPSEQTTNSVVNDPEDPTVFDEIHAKELLDQIWTGTLKSEYAWNQVLKAITIDIKGYEYKKEGLVWTPERVVIEENNGILFHGLKSTAGENTFYAGPVVRWWQEKPGSEVFYEATFLVTTGGSYHEWREKAYRYGVEVYADPPPEVIKVLSDNNVKLIY